MSEIFDKYIQKAREVNEELQLKPNQIEVQGKNIFGSLQGKDLSKISAEQLYELIKTKMPSLFKAIEAQGGLNALIGSDDKPDISVGLDGKIAVSPDA